MKKTKQKKLIIEIKWNGVVNGTLECSQFMESMGYAKESTVFVQTAIERFNREKKSAGGHAEMVLR